MNDNLDLPPRTSLPAETRDRIRAKVAAGLAEPARPARNRRYVPLAAAAGVLALATATVVVATGTGGEPAGDNRPAAQRDTTPPSATPTATKPDRFLADCIRFVNSMWPKGEQDWKPAADTTDGDVRVMMVRSESGFAQCRVSPGPNGEPPRVGPVTMFGTTPQQLPGPSEAPGLGGLRFDGDFELPLEYPLILTGLVSDQASGMTLTLSDGNTVEADVADGTVAALVRWDGQSVPEEGLQRVVRDLVVSVRVVDADGAVLYEGPLGGPVY